MRRNVASLLKKKKKKGGGGGRDLLTYYELWSESKLTHKNNVYM